MNEISKLIRDIEDLLVRDKYEEAQKAAQRLVVEASLLERRINNLKGNNNG